LEINSSEPVPGFNILSVEGTRNGASFACSGSVCSVPLLEGANDFTFWALSSWGDSSEMGTANGSVDTQPPFISGNLSGVAGSGGWFTSAVEVSASASDATSGVGSIVYSLDGAAPTGYTAPFTVGDGTHSIVFTATDVAGNSSSQTVSVNVDQGLPALTIDPPSGTTGDNGWFVSGAMISASAADGLSGLASLECSVDGGAPSVYSGPVALGDGSHTVTFIATDQAGNSASGSSTVNVDTQAPQLVLSGITSYCPGCGGPMAIDYSVGDPGSGVAEWTLSVDGTTLAGGTSAETGTIDWNGGGLPAGAHTITLQGRDLAGNVTQTDFMVTLLVPAATDVPTARSAPVRRATATRTAGPSAVPSQTPATNSSNPTTSAPTATKTNAVAAFVAPTRETQLQNAPSGAPAVTTVPGALFGAEAAAAIGAAMAVITAENKRRKEEEAKAAEESARFNANQIAIEEQRRQSAAQRAYEKKAQEELRQTFEAKIQEARNWGLNSYAEAGFREMAANQGYAAAIAALDSYIVFGMQIEAERKAEEERRKKEEEERKKEEEERKRREAEAWLAANAEKNRQAVEAEKERRRQVAAEAAAAEAEKNKPWWEKALDSVKDAADKAIKFVDDHQEAFSIGIGIAAGIIGAAAIVLTGGLAAPLLIAGVAALSAGAIVGAGTVGLNAYYGRPLDQNLIRNVGMSATTALVLSVTPSFIVAGQTIVATAVSSVGVLLGASAAVTTVLSSVAPVIGLAASVLVLGSMEVGGVGMAMADDPTISEEERQKGRDLEVLGLAGLTLGTGIFDTAESVNSAFPEGSEEAGTMPSEVRGLPPDNEKPPVSGEVKVGPASRLSEQAKGGQSLWDSNGGEWRYFPGDEYHNPHWDYNPHDSPFSAWQNTSINGLPPNK
jgi:hypothetical protein